MPKKPLPSGLLREMRSAVTRATTKHTVSGQERKRGTVKPVSLPKVGKEPK